MPATIPVASTDRVSRKTQNVMANQTVKFITETSKVLTSSVQERAVGRLAQVDGRRLRRSARSVVGMDAFLGHRRLQYS